MLPLSVGLIARGGRYRMHEVDLGPQDLVELHVYVVGAGKQFDISWDV